MSLPLAALTYPTLPYLTAWLLWGALCHLLWSALKLEERAEGEEFPLWDPDAVLLRIIRYDDGADEFAPEVRVSPNKAMLLRDLKRLLEEHPLLGHVPAAEQRLMKIIGVLGTARPTELVGTW